MFHGFTEFSRQAFHEKRVGFKYAEKFIGAGLAIAENGKRIWIVVEGLSFLVDRADVFIRFGKYW